MVELRDLPSPSDIELSLHDGLYLGRGQSGTVYAVDGDDRFVVKVAHSRSTGHVSDEIQITDHPKFGGRNFGQSVATYGEGVELLYYQRGNPLRPGEFTQVEQEKFAAMDEEARKPIREKIREEVKQRLHEAAEMPLSSYVALLDDINFLYTKGVHIDKNPRNLLIDVERQKFNLIDLDDPVLVTADRKFLEKLEERIAANPSDTKGQENKELVISNRYMCSPADIATMIVENTAGYDDEVIENRRMVLDKIMSAAEKLKIPFLRPYQETGFLNQCYEQNDPKRSEIISTMRAMGVMPLPTVTTKAESGSRPAPG